MESDHLLDEHIAQFAEAMNNGTYNTLPADLRQHLSSCEDCAQMVIMVSDTILEFSEASEVSGKSSKTYHYNWLLIAASALILVGGGYYLGLFSETNNLFYQSNNIHSINPTEQLSNNALLGDSINVGSSEFSAANQMAYVPNEELEKLCDRYSVKSLRGEAIDLSSETNIEALSGNLTLRWENDLKQELIVEFYNNAGDKLFESLTNASSIKPHEITEPGLYYWKLINQDFDLLFCGRFKIVE